MSIASQSRFLKDAKLILNNLNNNNNNNKDDTESKVDHFNNVTASNEQYQTQNAFSSNWTELKDNKTKLNKSHPTYAIPLNEKTLKRGIQAHHHIYAEIDELCKIIQLYGTKSSDSSSPGVYTVKFGTLFSVYNKISNKLVGLLLRCRKHGYVEFQGEVLFQGRDDNVVIKLIKTVQQN